MFDFLSIFLIVFAVQFGLVVVLGFQYLKPSQNGTSKSMNISVIIPFRNEVERIMGLLNSINKLKIPDNVTIELLFVDDHTEDETNRLISSTLQHPHQIIQNKGKGKKAAIRTAVEKASHQYMLTWDADIDVPEHYFEELVKLPDSDMVILPVKMYGNNLLSRLASIDFTWMQLVTNVFANWKLPILSNGANLLFKKEAFEEADATRTDYDRLSGDDIYLLKKFVELGKTITTSKNPLLKVSTLAPETMSKIKNQRKRWISKLTDTIDFKTAALAVVMLMMVFGSMGSLAHVLTYKELILLTPLILKILNEYILLRFYKGKDDLLRDFVDVIAHQFFFPVYMFYVIVNPIVEGKRWDH